MGKVFLLSFQLLFLFIIFVFQCHGLNWTQSGRLISLNDLGRSGSGSTSNITRRRSHEVVADLSPPRSRIGFVILTLTDWASVFSAGPSAALDERWFAGVSKWWPLSRKVRPSLFSFYLPIYIFIFYFVFFFFSPLFYFSLSPAVPLVLLRLLFLLSLEWREKSDADTLTCLITFWLVNE